VNIFWSIDGELLVRAFIGVDLLSMIEDLF
jgi:hypothetical protein